jgi:calcineurin-like phosphoesterase family protein
MIELFNRKYNNIYFTSDLHLYHRNILEYDSRPFENIEQHDQQLIANINTKVCENSLLFILGDICLTKNLTYIDSLLSQVKCDMILISGNHDSHLTYEFLNKHFLKVFNYFELKVNKKLFVLCHYPIYSWNRSHHGSIHLYGHTHKSSPELSGKSLNVGVCNSPTYSPFALEEILSLTEAMATGKHHDY